MQLKSGNHSTQHVLVVEDDYPIAELIRQVLEEEGYPVEIATTAIDALNPQVSPSLVVFDLNLGSARGEDVADLLREKSGHSIPMIAMSFDPAGHRRLRGHPNIVAYLHKPFDIDTLLSIVGTLLRANSDEVAS